MEKVLSKPDVVSIPKLMVWNKAQNPSMENYMLIQTDITAHMRVILINWLIEAFHVDELPQNKLILFSAQSARALEL